MKFNITMKDPDGFYESVKNAVEESLPTGLSSGERSNLLEDRMEKVEESLERWFEYNEYVTIEVDTDNNTATVLKTN